MLELSYLEFVLLIPPWESLVQSIPISQSFLFIRTHKPSLKPASESWVV